MEQLYIGAQSYSARLVLLFARFSRSQQLSETRKFVEYIINAIRTKKHNLHLDSKEEMYRNTPLKARMD